MPLNQLVSSITAGVTSSYTYNADGIRISKTVGTATTEYLLDGGNVVGEVQNGEVTATYLRGANLISRETDTAEQYYIFNAHGDVTGLVNNAQTIEKTYYYDAFGNEKNIVTSDQNPFRYCGEYFDKETGTYYLRARYYDPSIGRFTQQDTHWNTANMIYGDNPNKINEREDTLELKAYTYVPSIGSIMQSGNLFVYGLNNPIIYFDSSGGVVEIIHYKNPDRVYGHVDIAINGKVYSFAPYGLPSNTIRCDGRIMVVDKDIYLYTRFNNGDNITSFKINLSSEEENLIQATLDSYIYGAKKLYVKNPEYPGSCFYYGKKEDGLGTYFALGFNCVGFVRKVFADSDVSLNYLCMPGLSVLNVPRTFKYSLENSLGTRINEGVKYEKNYYNNLFGPIFNLY